VACGDSRDTDLMARLMAGEAADLVFSDPPYNVPIGGFVVGAGRHREFGFASGEMTVAEFTQFLQEALAPSVDVLRDGGVAYLCMDWRHLQELLSATSALGLAALNMCVWVKSNAGMGSLYRSQHELVFVLKKGNAAHANNVELGKHGRNRSNVWSYKGMSSFGAERDELLGQHPTVKPVLLVADALKDTSRRGDVVVDPFLGSGTTLIAAHRTGRRCRGVELDPAYVDVIIARWEAETGKDATLESTGETFQACREAMESLASPPVRLLTGPASAAGPADATGAEG
jgi:DNA modification methylase